MVSRFEIRQEMAFALDPSRSGSVRFSLEYAIGDAVVDLDVTLPQTISIERPVGFQGSGTQWAWDGTTASPSLTGSYRTASETAAGAMYVDAGDWAVVKAPSRAASWRYRGTGDVEVVQHARVDGPGIASPDGAIAFLGEHERFHHEGAGQRFTLAVPAAAELAEPPERIFAAVDHAARMLDVGGYRDEVLLIAAPGAAARWGPLGTQSGDSGFWSLDRCRLDRPNTTWVHEYVHTRQAPTLETSMDWFTEGTACYYATVCSIQREDISFDAGRRFLATDSDRRAVLTEPGTWSSPQTKYTKGRRAVAALDCELRRRTGGEADLRTVWRELNASYETAGYDEFTAALETAVPDPAGVVAWADRYIAGDGVPAVPSEPAAFGLGDAVAAADVAGPEPEPPDPEPEPEPESEPEPEREPAPEPEAEPELEPEPEPPGEIDACPVCDAPATPDDAYCDRCGTAIGRECHVCGTPAPGQTYCPECGTELVSTCELCGTQCSGQDAYCRQCGTEL